MLVGAVSTFNNNPRMLKQNDETTTNSASYQIRTANTVPRNFEGSSQLAFGMGTGGKLGIFGVMLAAILTVLGCNPSSEKPPVENTPSPTHIAGTPTPTPGATVTPVVTPTPIPQNQVLGKYKTIVINGLGLTEPYTGAAPNTSYFDIRNNLIVKTPNSSNADPTKLIFDVTTTGNGTSSPVYSTETWYIDSGNLMCQKEGLPFPLKVAVEPGVYDGVVSNYVKYYKPDGSFYSAYQKAPGQNGVVNSYTQVTTQANGKAITMKENGVPVMNPNPNGQLTEYKLNGSPIAKIDEMLDRAKYAKAYDSFMEAERNATPLDRMKAIVGEVIENGKGKVQGALAKTKNAAAAGETGYRVIFESGVELAMDKAGKIIGEVGDKVVKCA